MAAQIQPTQAMATAAQQKYGNVPLTWNGTAYVPQYTNPTTGQAYGSYAEWAAAQQPSAPDPNATSGDTATAGNPINYTQATAEASQQYGGTNDQSISDYATAAQNIATAAAQEQSDIKAEIPATQAYYSDIANLLGQSETTDTTQVKQEQTQALGSQATQAAASGFNPNSGFESTLATATNTNYNNQLQAISQKYNVQFDELAQQESQSIGDLTAQADNAALQGDEQTASMLKDVIALKQQQQQIVQTAAGNIISAGQEQEKIDTSKYTPVTAYNPTTGQYEISAFDIQTGQVVGGVPGTTSKSAAALTSMSASDIGQAAMAIMNGQATLSNYPVQYRAQITAAINAYPKNQ